MSENRVIRNIEFRPLRTGIICGGIFGVWLSFFVTPIVFKLKGIEISVTNFSISTLIIVLMIQAIWATIYFVKYRGS